MKKMILSVLIVAACATAGKAQAVATQIAPAAQENTAIAATAPAVQAADPQKVQVAKAELPQPILQLLTTDAYKDMEFQDAWLVKGATEVYLVNLKKGTEVTQLKLDKEGKTVS